MAQVGRISGPLLEANLLRKGYTNTPTQDDLKFRNTNDDPTLLKIDVTNGRVGVDRETPVNELHVSDTIRTVNLIGTTSSLANYTISTNNIDVETGDIYLNAGEHIQLSNLETEQFYASDNFIATKDTNTNIDLIPNGTGTLEVQSNLEVYGSLNATGNITLEGTITFGDALSQDTVDFNADVSDNIIPDVTDTYNLGNVTNRWKEISTNLLNGQLVASGTVNVDGMNLESRPGNIFYVAENGSNTNVGDHPNGPLATIEEALARCDASTTGPVTVYVYPGTYEETCPLVVPSNVQIVGIDIRNVIVTPTVATQDQDVFHLNDSSTISQITVKDHYYNSINNTGYAFRFAPGAVITNRSPYIQNVTVITKGSTTSVDDPRGFAAGDAGKGAWIDGAELDSASIEASMLFHSATFITPGVDAITMTNGVRVEWLNSFTYFANRGLYAVRGLTGRTTYDGSTIEYGAEVRSIGSANVYGNYGAVADGTGTLMYLIQHNMAYIGAGKYVDNDASRAIYANEVVESNSGKIHFTTTDHLGGFRIGDNFWVDFETGNTTINLDTLTVNQFNALRVNTGASTTVIDGAFIETGNFKIASNLIETYSGDINITAATGQINLQNNTNITGDLDISGNLSYDGVLNIKGDEATDTLTFNVEFEQDFNPNLNLTYDLGSFEKRWLLAHLNRIEAGDISIYDNVIETNVSNANLELRASGTGKVYIPENATFSNALTVNGLTLISDNVSITDPTFTQTGNTNQTGNRTVTDDATVGQNLDVGAAAQFEEILFDDNFITTTSTDADLELRAAGTGTVNIQTSVEVNNNLSADDVDIQTDATVALNTTADNANIGSVEINDNYIETTSLNGDLILAADRDVIVTGTDVTITPDLTVQGFTTLQGTSITGTVTHIGNTDQTGNVNLAGELTVDNVYIEDNFITTLNVNGNLTLSANGTGLVLIPDNDVGITNNLTVSTDTDLQSTTITGSLLHTGNRTQTGNYDIGGQVETFTVEFTVDVDGTFSTAGQLTYGYLNWEASDAGGNAIVDQLISLIDEEEEFSLYLNGNLVLTDTVLGNGAGKVYNVENEFHSVGFRVTTAWAAWTSLRPSGAITGDVVRFEVPSSIPPARGKFAVDDLYFEDNFITTTVSNADLELSATGLQTTPGELDFRYVENEFYFFIEARSQGSTTDYYVGYNFGTTEYKRPNAIGFSTFGPITWFVETTWTYLDHNGDRYYRGDLVEQVVYDVGPPLLYRRYYFINRNNERLPDVVIGASSISAPINDVEIANDLTVIGLTSLTNTTITGSLLHTGDRIQTGNYTLAGEISNGNILIKDNFIATTTTNSDLELRAAGTGQVVIDSADPITINNNLTVGGTLYYTGSLTINGDVVVLGSVQDGSLSVTENLSIDGTLDVGAVAQFEEILVDDNYITTTRSNADLELQAAGTGSVLVPNNNVQINNDLFTASISAKDVVVNNDLTLDELVITDSNIEINENYITTKTSNADLELRATGNVVVQENAVVEQNLSVNGNADLDDVSIVGNVTLTGDRTQTGNYTLDGNLNISSLVTDQEFQFDDVRISGNVLETTLSNSNLDLRAAGTGEILFQENVYIGNDLSVATFNVDSISVANSVDLEVIELSTDVQFSDNVITTTNSNSNLELRTNGSGSIYLQELEVNTDIIQTATTDIVLSTTNNVVITSTSALQIPKGLTSQRIIAVDTFLDGGTSLLVGPTIDGGDALTVFTSNDIIYNSGGAVLATSGNLGDIRFNTSDNVFEGTSANSTITLGGVYSENRLTSLTAHPTNNSINFRVNNVAVGTVTSSGLAIHALQVEDINVNGRTITTNVSNSDLELKANGTGELVLDELSLLENKIKNNGNNLVLKNIGFGKVKFDGTYGIAIPYGTTAQQPEDSTPPQIGDTRWNTDTLLLETWDGNQYITAAGVASAITPAEFDDLLLEYTLIFG